jgi:hypothetical protein
VYLFICAKNKPASACTGNMEITELRKHGKLEIRAAKKTTEPIR